MRKPIPEKITLHKERAELELRFQGEDYLLSAEMLRVLSPSAEVQGHSPEQKKVPLDKQGVTITHVEAQGNYAIRLSFNDGHDSGIYTWDYLYDLSQNKAQHWQRYLEEAEEERNKQNGLSAVKWVEP